MDLPLSGDNAFFLELYGRYRRDRSSVPADWGLYFEGIADEGTTGTAGSGVRLANDLIQAFRTYGHREANLDPLGLTPRTEVGLLSRLRSQITEQTGEASYRLGGQSQRGPLHHLVPKLTDIYAGTAAIEAAHIDDEEARTWIFEAFERAMLAPTDPDLLTRTLKAITLADEFESFVRIKFPTKKRFGIEGAESAAVAIREILREAAATTCDEAVIGGMHRGRLSTLATVLGKPLAMLLAEIKGRDLTKGGASFTGDVPYHLGHAEEIRFDEHTLKVTIAPHPSHLIVVAPVVTGLARAKQAIEKDREKVLCLLLHTDAAFSGQGLVAELLQLGGLAGYNVGGTVHLVVNNQIGFTTTPSEGRSSLYCTDIAKMTGVPVLHVNGDDPVAVARMAQLAIAWRHKYKRDILIDLVCYRRNGHNELDEPRFTLPQVWKTIDTREPLRDQLIQKVAAAEPRAVEFATEAALAFREELHRAYTAIDSFWPNRRHTVQDQWVDVLQAEEQSVLDPVTTGVDHDLLIEVGQAISTVPSHLTPHPKVSQFYKARLESIQEGTGINFATAEALAFGSLLSEGVSVRLSGQDCIRGTFTQRHLGVFDLSSEAVEMPVRAAARNRATFEAINSPLSEYGVLAFEYGHSLADPGRLVVWEAQFGDFLNGAQIAVDQFIVSAEAKWQMMSGLVMLLPHGLEGQGPDHSSARIERLLQLCANGNIIVANPSTPANYFHLLRRQIRAPWRKPLFVIAPKSLLRQKVCASSLAEMTGNTRFCPVMPDNDTNPKRIRKIVLCSGKIFYDLKQSLDSRGPATDIALIRIEQLYPFPADELRSTLARFPKVRDWIWCQEEPENQGGWLFVRDQLARHAFPWASALRFAGRPAMPVPAGGSIDRHDMEQAEIVKSALGLRPEARRVETQ